MTSVAVAQTEVTQGVTIGKDYGVVYTLPKTEISIEIKAIKTIYTPGEFSKYADRYLHLNEVSPDSQEYWTLKEVKALSVGVPDNTQTYFIKLKDNTVAPLVELTADGLIKSINVPYSEKKTSETNKKAEAPKKKLNPKDFLTEEVLRASSTAKRAELVAKEIYYIRESRNALLRGQADNTPKDGEQLRLMLDNLDLQETAMIEMFSGTKSEEEKIYTIRLTPTREMEDEVVFRFSQKLGVLGKDNLAGAPIYLSLKDLKTIAIPEVDDNRKKKIDGIAYNVPGKARITLTDGRQKLFENDLSVTQLGVVEYLAASLFNKKTTFKVIFNPDTGGILKVDREE